MKTLLFSLAACALPAFAHANDAALDAYARPATLVDIGHGRHLDLRCSGTGSPTAVLESGARADSLAWREVQPEIAKTNRVCAYDRAGYGFSDEGPMPRDLDAGVADLHALIAAAHIPTPIVLVGHSIGTNIARLYATRYAADVAALVLVDPPEQNVAAFSPSWAKTETGMRAQAAAFARRCEEAATNGRLAKPAGDLARCIRAGDPAFPDALNAAIHRQKERPAFWHTMMSEWSANDIALAQPVSTDESHGAIPLIVLTASDTFEGVPPDDRKALEAAREKTHAAIVATSTRGERRRIEKSGHDIEIDQPEAVVAAVRDAISRSTSR